MSSDLVKLLKAQAAKGSSIPRIAEAALGVNGSWWVQFTDKTSKYDLTGYSSLEKLFRDKIVTDRTINASLILIPLRDVCAYTLAVPCPIHRDPGPMVYRIRA